MFSEVQIISRVNQQQMLSLKPFSFETKSKSHWQKAYHSVELFNRLFHWLSQLMWLFTTDTQLQVASVAILPNDDWTDTRNIFSNFLLQLSHEFFTTLAAVNGEGSKIKKKKIMLIHVNFSYENRLYMALFINISIVDVLIQTNRFSLCSFRLEHNQESLTW